MSPCFDIAEKFDMV